MASKTEKKENLFGQQYLAPLQYSILEKLNEFGPMTRDQLCKEFGFGTHKVVHTEPYLDYHEKIRRKEGVRREFEQYDKRTTIYDNLVKLEKRKLVENFSKSNGKRGRPPTFWKIKK